MTASAIAAIYDRLTPRVEEALIATAKALGWTVPAARRDPFFRLDRLGGPPLSLVERLTAGGDFRKYVFVLDAGGGFGGLARWIATTERSAHDAFLRLLAERCPDAARAWHRAERARGTIAAILRGPDYRTVQLSARRPS